MSVLGDRVLRAEDPRFLRDEATYIETLSLEGADGQMIDETAAELGDILRSSVPLTFRSENAAA